MRRSDSESYACPCPCPYTNSRKSEIVYGHGHAYDPDERALEARQSAGALARVAEALDAGAHGVRDRHEQLGVRLVLAVVLALVVQVAPAAQRAAGAAREHERHAVVVV